MQRETREAVSVVEGREKMDKEYEEGERGEDDNDMLHQLIEQAQRGQVQPHRRQLPYCCCLTLGASDMAGGHGPWTATSSDRDQSRDFETLHACERCHQRPSAA